MCDQLCVDLNGTQACRCHKDYWMDRVSGECRVKGDNDCCDGLIKTLAFSHLFFENVHVIQIKIF